jgi:hypothetical protein
MQLTRRTQRGVLCDVMLSANECGAWLTLRELGRLTRYPPASISAQLRHLRKARYGGFVIEKRRREDEELGLIEGLGAVWEYRLRRGVRTSKPKTAWTPQPPAAREVREDVARSEMQLRSY